MDRDFENGELSDADQALLQAIVSLGLMGLHGGEQRENHRHMAVQALRELTEMIEDGEDAYVGCARLGADMVDNYANDEEIEGADERADSFSRQFSAGIPTLVPVPDPES